MLNEVGVELNPEAWLQGRAALLRRGRTLRAATEVTRANTGSRERSGRFRDNTQDPPNSPGRQGSKASQLLPVSLFPHFNFYFINFYLLSPLYLMTVWFL